MDADLWPATQFTLVGQMGDWQNHAAWKTFVDLYAPVIYRLGRRRGLQEADTADVVQNVLVRVSRAIRTFEPDHRHGRFRNWLITITSNEIRRHFRSDRGGIVAAADQSAANLVPAELEAAWIEQFQARVYQCALERTRGGVEEDLWQAFELVWLQGRKPQEAAVTLGRRIDWVYKAKHRVLQKLKQEVELLASDAPLAALHAEAAA
ncbi:MAG: sigma-70 family RNA polymerase sigma factor [Pirellulales bacterium]|nr:sigma-70 family RNA polymerase sigma factor [Pirellulales bacterium]